MILEKNDNIQNIVELFSFDGADFIEAAYQCLLGRTPDASGLRYYLGRLALGYSKESVIEQIALSNECRTAKNIIGLEKLLKIHRRKRHFLWRYFLPSKHSKIRNALNNNTTHVSISLNMNDDNKQRPIQLSAMESLAHKNFPQKTIIKALDSLYVPEEQKRTLTSGDRIGMTVRTQNENPKILHRIYFDNFAPFNDPFEHYMESWKRELPDYKIMKWNISNLDVDENAWTKLAWSNQAPVFLSEYFRWKVLAEYGGVYLDADCEILDGKVLRGIIDELYSQNEYDVFFGVEERETGHPTAQTIGAKKGADLVSFMKRLYEKSLPEMWEWRERRLLIGPQLMSLFFLNNKINEKDDGYFKNLDNPTVFGTSKVYPQTYFSPKFSILGDDLDFQAGKTCVYHMFANSNVDFSDNERLQTARDRALTFSEYRDYIAKLQSFPRFFDSSSLSSRSGKKTDFGIEASGTGVFTYGPYISLRPGFYSARVKLSLPPNTGIMNLSITSNCGRHMLGMKSFQSTGTNGFELDISCEFAVLEDRGKDIEFVLEGENIDAITISGIEVNLLSTVETVYTDGVNGTETATRPVEFPKNSLKKLHRIYFGFDGRPDQHLVHLETWKKQLPDFEIITWNAENLPININDFSRQMYAEKDHAFLTDYFRWYVLKEYGGTYLDADVEVVNGKIYRSLIQNLEDATDYDAFIGIDKREDGWYTAHSMASKQKSELAEFMCQVYENFGFFSAWRKKALYLWAPQLVALYFSNKGYNIAGMGTSPNLDEPKIAERVKVYPQDYFSPLSPTGMPGQPFSLDGLSANTCLCHHFACSWHDTDSYYLKHSQDQGGLANALLQDIIRKKL